MKWLHAFHTLTTCVQVIVALAIPDPSLAPGGKAPAPDADPDAPWAHRSPAAPPAAAVTYDTAAKANRADAQKDWRKHLRFSPDHVRGSDFTGQENHP
jgi:hypothetical protein